MIRVGMTAFWEPFFFFFFESCVGAGLGGDGSEYLHYEKDGMKRLKWDIQKIKVLL